VLAQWVQRVAAANRAARAPDAQMSPSERPCIDAGPCTLEPLARAHAAEMFVVLGDPALYEFERAPPPSLTWLSERYARLEAGAPPGTGEHWLNWVIRLPDGALAGHVQATVLPDRQALVAYELSSAHWRRGIGSAAVRAMLHALHEDLNVRQAIAVLKAANYRSLGLLRHLGFEPASAEVARRWRDDEDECVMVRALDDSAGG